MPVHPICHRTIHVSFTNLELARFDAEGRSLLELPELRAFLAWIAGKPPDFHAPTRRRM